MFSNSAGHPGPSARPQPGKRKGNAALLMGLFFLLFFCASGVFAQEQETYDPTLPQNLHRKPVILFWCDNPLELENITHVANKVWVPGDDEAEQQYRQDRVLARGLIPLDWVGGMNRAGHSEEDLIAYYTGKLMFGYAGIAIDEIGGYDIEVNRKFTRVFGEIKRRFPDRVVAVWHAGFLTKEHLEMYRNGADIVMFERYLDGTAFITERLSYNLNMARNGGIVEKCIFALGLDEERWINTIEELEVQMHWIAENAPEMRGIAVFAPDAPEELVRAADRLAGELFIKK